MIKFTIITLFPDAIQPYLATSMMWKAADRGLAEFDFVNLRDFGLGPHKSVDDTPYGGGDGMLLRCEPVFAAIESVKTLDPSAKVILPTPVGQIWNQQMAQMMANGRFNEKLTEVEKVVSDVETTASLHGSDNATVDGNVAHIDSVDAGSIDSKSNVNSSSPRDTLRGSDTFARNAHFIILCPHYEGYDERILSIVDYKISLGKYVLTGGELPALIIIDSVVRLIHGVLGGEKSAEIESFSDGDNLEYPQYTKPYDFRGMTVPDVLLSGNHGEIAKWRAEHSGRME